DLETIVLKAMEKRPQDRYATAQEMADDLQRFLQDQPIRARRPSVPARLGKWGRRHRPLVRALLVLLLLSLVLLAASNLLIRRAQREALQAQEDARDALRKAQLHEKEVGLLVSRMIEERKESE